MTSDRRTPIGANVESHIVVFMLCALIVRIWAISLTGGWPLLDDPHDFFADAIKSALAIRSITARLWHDPTVATWPRLFQSYLLSNAYLTKAPLYQEPPLGILLMAATAKALTVFNPVAVLCGLGAAYSIGALAILRATRLVSGLLLWLSFPALYMFSAGNLHAGIAAMCVIGYLLTAVLDRHRLAGLALMVIAINLRPNVGLVLLIEFVGSASALPAARRIFLTVCTSVVVMAAAFVLAHVIDPVETPAAFLTDLGRYHRQYDIGPLGLPWNESMFGFTRHFRILFGVQPDYSPSAYAAVAAVATGAITALAVLSIRRRLSAAEAVFLTTTTCVLFTPVVAEYHMLMMLGPLLILLRSRHGQVPADILISTGIAFTIATALVALLQTHPGPGTALTMVGGMIGMMIFLRLWLGRARNEDLMLLASVLAVSPIGGSITQSVAVTPALFGVFVIVTFDCWRRAMVTAQEGALAAATGGSMSGGCHSKAGTPWLGC